MNRIFVNLYSIDWHKPLFNMGMHIVFGHRILLIAVLLIYLFHPTFAQKPNTNDTLQNISNTKIVDIASYVLIKPDTEENTKELILDEILKLQDFQSFVSFDTIMPKKWYYGKIIIKSDFNTDLNIGLYLSNADIQQFYVPNTNQRLITGGYRSKKKNNELIYKSNIVMITLEKNSVTEIYFKLKSYNSFTVTPVIYPLSYVNEVLKPKESDESTLKNFFFGSFFIILISSILIFLFSRKRVHFYYAVYVLFIGIINSSFDFFLEMFGMSGRYMFFSGEFLGGFAWISYFSFIQLFLETKRKFPFWHKVLNVAILSAVLFMIYILTTLLILHNNILYHQYRNIYALVVAIITLSAFLRFVLSRDQMAVFIGSGGLITLLSWIIYLSTQFWGFKDINIVRGGQLIEVMIFALAIALQIQNVYKENARIQKEIINQLESNRVFQEKVNAELEGKVKERTNELLERNEELFMQTEEIRSQNEQLENAFNEISNQKEQIELAHKEMTNSIIYAKRIQNAVLSRAFAQKHNYQGYFVYFAPKNIVSGDFFYMQQKGNKLYIVVADCTGHGVPGAFMSILGITLLDEIIKTNQELTTAQILDRLREDVKTSLQQIGTIGEQQDGMDIAICSIDQDTLEMSFSGAYNPCLVYRDNKTTDGAREPEIHTMEPDRMPIGVYIHEKPFGLRHFQLQKADTLYLFSDGFHSQFGGPKDEKLKTRRFKSLLSDVYHLPFEIQKEIIEDYLIKWKGDKKQTDDILVLGFKV